MKKHLILAMAAIFSTAMFFSCGPSPKAKITITEDDAECLTDVVNLDKFGERNNDFIQMVPGVYDVVLEEGNLCTTIPLKIVEGTKHPTYIVESFILDIYGPDDKYVKINDEKVEFHAIDKQEVYKELCNSTIGDIVKVTFKYIPTNSEEMEEVAKLISSCEITLYIEEPDED